MPPIRSRGSVTRLFLVPALLAIAFLLALLLAPRAQAAGGDLVWFLQGPEDVLCSGEIEDQDGDGVPDLVVESYDAGASGDHLFCLSGGAPGPNAVTIWSTRPVGGPSNSGSYGSECLVVGPDMNRDGNQDVVLGTAWGGRTAYVLNGTNGAIHWSFDTYSDSPPNPPESGWVYTVSWAPDTNGDDVPDVFFGCGSDNNRFYHANGSTGSIFWNLPMGDAVFSSVVLGDVTGDGRSDCAAGVGDNADAVWVLRGGATGVPLVWNEPMPGTVMAVERIEDITGNGLPDVIVGMWNAQEVWAFEGATGDTAWIANLPGTSYVMRLAALDDVNNDGYQDIAVGSWSTAVWVVSGRDGTILWSKQNADDNWAIGRVEDVTGDGINDVVAGSFDTFVYLLDGVTGDEVWRYSTGNRLYWVAGTSDLTGNGVPDVFAGSQMLSGPPGGRGYLLEGGELATPAELPMWTSAVSTERGVEVRLGGARGFEHAWVERHGGEAEGVASAAARFRQDVIEAYAEGLLDARGAIAARQQDPQVTWTRVSAATVPIVAGQAIWIDESAEAGASYTYRFAFEADGSVAGYSPVASVRRSEAGADPAIPPIVASPNPASGNVRIDFRIPRTQEWRVEAFDAAGRRVADLGAGDAAGDVRLGWDGRDADGLRLPTGVYFVRLTARDFVSSRKVTLLR